MRELCVNEIKVISGAGIVADDPNFKDTMLEFNGACIALGFQNPVLRPSINASKTVVNGAASIIDAALTSAFNNIMSLLGD